VEINWEVERRGKRMHVARIRSVFEVPDLSKWRCGEFSSTIQVMSSMRVVLNNHRVHDPRGSSVVRLN